MTKSNLLPVLAVAGILFSTSSHSAHIREFQTTRLNSTAGAGVASLLSTEAAILNPASSAYFEGNDASYQSYTTSIQHKNTLRDTNNDPYPKKNRSQGLFLSDSSSGIKGGAAYLSQKENRYERERMVLHGSAPMGPKSSLGVTYNFIQDVLPRNRSDRHRTHHQLSMGLLQVLDEATTVGLVITDPTRTTPGEEKLIAGFQYQLATRFVILGDLGATYTKNFSDNYLWRGALQINFFEDFFLRAGRFQDSNLESKGTGWGASWIGPKLGVEFAQKISEFYGKSSYMYKNEKLVDTSISAVIKF
ncbi:MAG: hypothetical protein V4598_14705 [Bdellovibrionota bacterium]